LTIADTDIFALLKPELKDIDYNAFFFMKVT